jgi:hypothetical protein
MDKRSISEGSNTSESISLDFGSLASKVFDYAFELPPLDMHLRVWLQSEILSKTDSSRSLVDYITQGRIDCGDPKQVAASIAAGMFCSSELSTPRVLERVLSKLHSMPLANPTPNGHACHSELAYTFFGFSIAIRERFPDVSEFVPHELPSHLRAYLSNGVSVPEKTRIFEDKIMSLHSKKQRDVLISMLANSGVFFSVEPASRETYSKNITSVSEIVHGIDWASILIRGSLT